MQAPSSATGTDASPTDAPSAEANAPSASNDGASETPAPGFATKAEQGAYLALAGNCASCHTTADGAFLAGGVRFETPFGAIYSTNITPDEETGIGRWTEADFVASMRRGVRPDGEHLYPAFPYTAFTRATDEDLAALYAWLMSVDPVRAETPANDLSFPFDQRALLGIWKLLFLEEGPIAPDETRDAKWNRGAYLVEAFAHCSACHSPRNLLGAEQTSLAYAGGEYVDRVPGGGYRPWSAPNLTGSERGLGSWSEAALADYLGTARNAFLEAFGPMTEVVMNSTRHLHRDDVEAMATYLKSLPAIEPEAAVQPDATTLGRGRTVYNLHCGTCHLPGGEGDPEMAPRLAAGSLVVQDANPASLLNVILYAPAPPHPPLEPRWRNPMDAFQYELDDEEVAALASYLRHSWGNAADAVDAEAVRRQR